MNQYSFSMPKSMHRMGPAGMNRTKPKSICTVRINSITFDASAELKSDKKLTVYVGGSNNLDLNGAHFTPSTGASINKVWTFGYDNSSRATFFLAIKKYHIMGDEPYSKNLVHLSKFSPNKLEVSEVDLKDAKGQIIGHASISVHLAEGSLLSIESGLL